MSDAQIAQHLSSALTHLKAERARVADRISQLESALAKQSAVAKATSPTEKRKPGRPPKAAAAPAPAPVAKKKAAPAPAAAPARSRKKPVWSAAARAAARERMRKYWADRNKK